MCIHGSGLLTRGAIDPLGQLLRRNRRSPGSLDCVSLGQIASGDNDIPWRSRLYRKLLDKVVGCHSGRSVQHRKGGMRRRPLDGNGIATPVKNDAHTQSLEIVEYAKPFDDSSAGNIAPLGNKHAPQFRPCMGDVVAIHEQVFRKLHRRELVGCHWQGNTSMTTRGPEAEFALARRETADFARQR